MVSHGTTGINHEVEVDVGVFPIGFGQKLSPFRIDLPIDQLQVLPGNIISVLEEFSATPVVQTSMQTRQHPLDDQSGEQRIVFYLGQPSRIQEVLIDSHESTSAR